MAIFFLIYAVCGLSLLFLKVREMKILDIWDIYVILVHQEVSLLGGDLSKVNGKVFEYFLLTVLSIVSMLFLPLNVVQYFTEI